MSTIQTKRKKSTGNANVTLVAAEPYYNLADKALYLGDADGTNTFEGKKHIAELSVSSDTARQLKLAIGEAKGNDITLKVAHTDDTHTEGVEVSDKAITLYVDSYTKQEIQDINTDIGTNVDGKITTATTLHLTANTGENSGTANFKVGTNDTNSFDILLNHTATSSAPEGVFWSEQDNILYITVSAYNKSEIDTKFTDAKQELNARIDGVETKIDEVSADLSANYYTTDYTYNKTEVDSKLVTDTAMSVSANVGNEGPMLYLKVGTDSGVTLFLKESNNTTPGWYNDGSASKAYLHLKPYYTKSEIDGMIDEGIAGKMSVENGVLKFSNS